MMANAIAREREKTSAAACGHRFASKTPSSERGCGMSEMLPHREIIVYKGDGNVSLEVKTDGETVWLTQEQICALFGRDRTVVTKHINNVFKEGELPKEGGYVQILHKTSPDGGRPVAYYNLDVVISVGYRVKSVQGTRFRQWATRMLREMLLNRFDEVKRIGNLERRMDAAENGIKRLEQGVNYLVTQISDPPSLLPKNRRRIGFCIDNDDVPTKPYGKKKGGAA